MPAARHDVRWSLVNIDDLGSIVSSIQDDRPSAAREVLGRLEKRAGALERNPHRGRVVPGCAGRESQSIGN